MTFRDVLRLPPGDCCRANNVAVRQRYVKLVDSVRDMAGEVKIFSSLHVSGERKSTAKY